MNALYMLGLLRMATLYSNEKRRCHIIKGQSGRELERTETEAIIEFQLYEEQWWIRRRNKIESIYRIPLGEMIGAPNAM